MVRKSSKDRFAQNVLIGAGALLILALAALAFQLVRGRTTAPTPSTETPPTPLADTVENRRLPSPKMPVASAAPAQPEPAPASAETPLVLRSDELRKQYSASDVGADQKYKDKLLEVTGTVSAVYQESPLIGISFGLPNDPMPAVLCDLDRQQRDQLNKLRRGQKLTVRGKCTGKTQEGFIGLANCRMVSENR